MADNRYELHALIGEGGQGRVFQAFDRLTNHTVALKSIPRPPQRETSDWRDTQRSLAIAHEFQVLSALRHPNILTVLDFGFDEEGTPFFTMPLIENAQPLLQITRTADLATRLDFIIDLLQAVIYLHRHNVLHRDLKPSNLLVENGQHLWVVDFGVAFDEHRIGAKTIAGTVGYMAPEVVSGGLPTTASDLFSIGVLLYELVTGKQPFEAPTVHQVIQRVLYTEPDWDEFLSAVTGGDPVPFTPSDEGEMGTLAIPVLMHLAHPEAAAESATLLPEDRPLTLMDVAQRLLAKQPSVRYSRGEDVLDDLCRAVDRPVPPETQAIRESFLTTPRFVGRENEMGQLGDALKHLEGGRGSAWLIGGESGIGKTRLLNETAIQAMVKGFLVLRGDAASEGGMLYHVWRDVARRLLIEHPSLDKNLASTLKLIVPDIARYVGYEVPDAAELTGEAAQTRLRLALESLFQIPRQIVLLVDDLQWAKADLDLLRRLVDLTAAQPLLIIGSYRSDEAHDLPNLLPNMTSLHLDRLDQAAITKMSVGMLGQVGSNPSVVERLTMETEGNAYFVVETIRTLAEGISRLSDLTPDHLPDHITIQSRDQVLQWRVARVAKSHRPLLRLAAVAGRNLDLAVLKTICATHPRDLFPPEELEDWLFEVSYCGVIEARGNTWQLQHDKLRETLLAGLTPKQVAAHHRWVAEGIEKTYPKRPEYYPILLEHWRGAGHTSKIARYAELTAEQFQVVGRNREAKQLLEDALARVAPNSLTALRLKNSLAVTLLLLGENDTAVEVLNQLVSATESDPKQQRILANALAGLGGLAQRRGDLDGSEALYERALAINRALKNRKGMIITSLRLGGSKAFFRRNIPAALPYFDEALRLARQLKDSSLLASCLSDLGCLAIEQEDFAASERQLSEAASIFQAIGNRRSLAMVYGNISIMNMQRGDLAAALRDIEGALEQFRVIGDRFSYGMALIVKTQLLLKLERIAEVQAALVEALEISLKVKSANIQLDGLPMAAELAVRQQDWANAVRWLAGATTHPRTKPETVARLDELRPAIVNALGEAETEKLLDEARAMTLDALATTVVEHFKGAGV